MMKQLTSIMKKCNEVYLFYIGYFILLLVEMWNNLPIVRNNHNLLILLGLAVIVIFNIITIVKQKQIYRKKENIFFLLIAILCFFCYLFSKNFTILKYAIIMFSFINLNFETFIKTDLKMKILLFVSVFLLYMGNALIYNEFSREDGSMRYALGFNHPNTLGMYLMMISLEFLYIKRNDLKWYYFPLIIFIILFIMIIPQSRTSAIAIIIYLGYLIFRKWIIKILNNKVIRNILLWIVPILTLCSLGLTFGYQKGLFIRLNDILSDRLNYYHGFLASYDVTLFGTVWNEKLLRVTLDNSYIFLLLQFGILIYLIFTLISIKGLRKIINMKNYDLFIILEILFLYGMMETTMLNVTMNPFLIGLSLWLQNKGGEQNE